MSIKVESQELQEAVADQRTRSDKRRENFEALKAQFIDQQEVSRILLLYMYTVDRWCGG